VETQRRPAARKQLTPAQMSTIHNAVAQAGFAGFKINLMHLSPMDDAAAGHGTCHAQQLPNGQWVIVCN
jgi:hypothetical protein